MRAFELALAAAIGFAAGWILRAHPPLPASDRAEDVTLAAPARPTNRPAIEARTAANEAASRARGTVGTGGSEPAEPAVDALREKSLRLPIDGADVTKWLGMFGEPRDQRGRAHEAVDILAPRNTPIHAVEGGTIAKLFFSKGGGGNTIYQYDPSGRFCYYYAHLERYAEGLTEGDHVSEGEVIGYVGTSGNAPPDTPHLHFAIFELTPEREWWKGRAIDPYQAFKNR